MTLRLSRGQTLLLMLLFTLGARTFGLQTGAYAGVRPSHANCVSGTEGRATESGLSATTTQVCDGSDAPSAGRRFPPPPPMKFVDCGPRQSGNTRLPTTGTICANTVQFCLNYNAAPVNRKATTQAVFQQNPDGSWTEIGQNCNVLPATAPRQVTAQMATDAARRLLPHPNIHSTDARTLVNIETVFWIDTAASRTLGTVGLLGYQVSLRARISSIDWDFGDGHTDTTTSPEPAYDASRPCDTVSCPDYYGHTYTATGTPATTAAITWTGQYRVDNGPWLDILGTVTAPATATAVTVRQARGVLVPNPNH